MYQSGSWMISTALGQSGMLLGTVQDRGLDILTKTISFESLSRQVRRHALLSAPFVLCSTSWTVNTYWYPGKTNYVQDLCFASGAQLRRQENRRQHLNQSSGGCEMVY